MASRIRLAALVGFVLLTTACNSALAPKVTYDPVYSFRRDAPRLATPGANPPSMAVVPDNTGMNP